MKVIKPSQLPTKVPLFQTLTTVLALSYWKAPGWVWGSVGLLFLIIIISCVVGIFKQEETDVLFDDEKQNKGK